jgi:sugar phosphate isomerase/epimerase
MSIDVGVTLFSMTNEWLAGQYTLPSLIDEVGRRKLGPGVELIGFQSLRGFPNQVSADDIRDLRSALERNELHLSALASNADVARHKSQWMDADQSVEYMRPQIAFASELGVPVVRIQIGLTPEVLEKLEPIAAQYRVKLGMEIHAPEGANTPKVMATREVYERIDSEFLGFIPDFSATMRAIPPGMLAKLRRGGLSEAGISALDTAWRANGPPFQRYSDFAEQSRELGEPELPVAQARLIFTMFGRESLEDWRELFPRTVHIHAKYYDIDDMGESPSIDYRSLMRVFSELDRPVSMSSEWEGHAFLDLEEQDAFEMVAQHQAMCRRFLAAS